MGASVVPNVVHTSGDNFAETLSVYPMNCPIHLLPPASSLDGFGPPHLARKSNGEVGEERPSRRGIKTVALVISWGSPQSDNCHKCVRLVQKDAAAGVSGMRLAKAFGPVRRQP